MFVIAPLPQPGYLELCYLLGLPAAFPTLLRHFLIRGSSQPA